MITQYQHNDDSSVHDTETNEIITEKSMPLSTYSKKTGVSKISQGVISKLSKKTILPKEGVLREAAEKKDLELKLKEID